VDSIISRLRWMAQDLDAMGEVIVQNAARLAAIADELEGNGRMWHDLRPELFRHPNPTNPVAWWQRTLPQIDGLTLHHTLSDSPHALAEWYCQSRGRPSIPYSIWISQTGDIYLCLDFVEGCWHDHTGHENTHLSVGLAGRLHEYRPAEVQLRAAAYVAAWAIRHPDMSVTRDTVVGHDEYARTQCPGWDSPASGRWRSQFYSLLDQELEE
jgi:hypothetical protein